MSQQQQQQQAHHTVRVSAVLDSVMYCINACISTVIQTPDGRGTAVYGSIFLKMRFFWTERLPGFLNTVEHPLNPSLVSVKWKCISGCEHGVFIDVNNY